MKYFLLVVGFASLIYFVKNVKVSVSGAEAGVEEPLPTSSDSSSDVIDKPAPIVDEKTQERKPAFQPKVVETSHQKELLQRIRRQDLCGFVEYAEENSISKNKQIEALEVSFSDPKIKELMVFFENDLDSIKDYQSTASQFYILALKLRAFEQLKAIRTEDIEKGLSSKDQQLMIMVDLLANRDSGNLIYTMLRNQIYVKYKNVGDEHNQKVFDWAMTAEKYENPIFERVRRLYQKAKNNVVQFYLSYEIFKKRVNVDRYFTQRLLWNFYDPEMRDHVSKILLNSVERNSESHKTYGYEKAVYQGYRGSVPYDLYETLPAVDDYDKTRAQPTYEIDELKLDLAKGCVQAEVEQLKIKLRAI